MPCVALVLFLFFLSDGYLHTELKEAMEAVRSSCDDPPRRTERKGGMVTKMMHREHRGHRGECEAIR